MKYKLYVMQHPQFDYLHKYIRTEAEKEGEDAPTILARDFVADPAIRASNVTTAEDSFTIGAVTIREATAAEKEDFVTGHGIYNCFPYPEMKGQIIKAIDGWNNTLPFDQVVGEIMANCKDECSSPRAVLDHFREKFEHRYSPRQLRQLVDMLNFPAVREVAAQRRDKQSFPTAS